MSKDGYPELEEKQAMIFKVLSEEEEKFNKTIDQGLSILGEMEDEMQKTGNKCLSGANAFKLYDTYGFLWISPRKFWKREAAPWMRTALPQP